MAKQLKFGEDARASLVKGIEKILDFQRFSALFSSLSVADEEYFYHCCITSHFLVFLDISGFVSLCKFLLFGITLFIFA